MTGPISIQKIVSGGQSGVDRAALDVAIALELPHGGWCPKGRRAEDGPIPEEYLLKETEERDYSVRTEKNVVESDGTLILFRDLLSGGTKLTVGLGKRHRRPVCCVDLGSLIAELDAVEESEDISALHERLEKVRQWIVDENIGVLNVAGPRESSCAGIHTDARQFLWMLFSK